MKKLLLCAGALILTTGCFLSTKTPAVQINGQTFHLTRAFSTPDKTVNIYTSDSDKETKLYFTREVAGPHNSFDDEVQFHYGLTEKLGENYAMNVSEDHKQFSFSMQEENKENKSYGYIKQSWQPDGSVETVHVTGIPIEEHFVLTFQKWGTVMDNLDFVPLYSVRPGHKKPDESQELERIKQLIGKPYNPKKQIWIGKESYVDSNQEEVFLLITMGNAPDATEWLKENIAKYSPVYLYALANRVALQREPAENFTFWSFAAYLRAHADRALCKDKYVGKYITNRMIQTGKVAAATYKEEDLAAVNDKAVLRKVVQWDKKHPQKNNPDWMCKSDPSASNGQTYPQKEWKTRRKEFKTKYTASAFK